LVLTNTGISGVSGSGWIARKRELSESRPRSHVALHDNFFESGGDSLMAMQIVAGLQQEFAIDAPIAVIFERPTVIELAAYVRESLLASRDAEGEARSGSAPIPTRSRRPRTSGN
jgi:acyl carrier protein